MSPDVIYSMIYKTRNNIWLLYNLYSLSHSLHYSCRVAASMTATLLPKI